VEGAACQQGAISIAPFAQIDVVNPARCAWRILARTFRNQMPNVRHKHVATESRDQRLFGYWPRR
jgi:hypothetical protein